MSARWYSVVVDCRDIGAQARWWGEVLDWPIVYEAEDEVVIAPPHAVDDSRQIPLEEQSPGLVFVSVPDDKQVKNRLHIDLAPPGQRRSGGRGRAARLDGSQANRRRAGREPGLLGGAGRSRGQRVLRPELPGLI